MDNNMDFYIIGNNNDYVKAMWREALSLPNVTYIDSPMLKDFVGKRIFNKIENKLYSYRINLRCKLPGKFIWRNKYSIEKCVFDRSKNNIIIFSDIMRILSDVKYWEAKKKKENLTYCLILLNSCCHDLNKSKLENKRILEFLPVDYIYTFDSKDAFDYQLNYFESMLSRIEFNKPLKKQYDFYFVGQKKNRLNDIYDLYKKIKNSGYTCLFRITGVTDQEKIDSSDIIFNEKISYKEVVEELNCSKCIVDIKVPEQSGLSLRYFEAVLYNKLLLTNNISIKKTKYYNSNYMFCFNSIDQVALTDEFVQNTPNYEYCNDYSPLKFLNELSNRIGGF